MSNVRTCKLPSYQQDQLGFKQLCFFFQTSSKPQQNQLSFLFPVPNHPANAQLNTPLYSFSSFQNPFRHSLICPFFFPDGCSSIKPSFLSYLLPVVLPLKQKNPRSSKINKTSESPPQTSSSLPQRKSS